MTIRITQKHVDGGKQNRTFLNPIALAFQEKDRYAVVTADRVHLTQPSGIFYLPHEAILWLRDFNAGRRVSPFIFDLQGVL